MLKTMTALQHLMGQFFDKADHSPVPTPTFSFEVPAAIEEVATMLKVHSPSCVVRTYYAVPEKTHARGNKFLFQEVLLSAIQGARNSYQVRSYLPMVLVTVRELAEYLSISVIDGGRKPNPLQKVMVLADSLSSRSEYARTTLPWIRSVISHHFYGQAYLRHNAHRGNHLVITIPKLIQV